MRILFVDAHNVCGSASAGALMRNTAQSWGMSGIQVASAGYSATPGIPHCEHAPALLGARHVAHPLSTDLAEGADLILTCNRKDAAGVAALTPAERTKVFSVRQVGRWSDWLMKRGFVEAARAQAMNPQGWDSGLRGPVRNVSPLTVGADPVKWAVFELDSCRGLAPDGMPNGTKKSLLGRRKEPAKPEIHPDDTPNPHNGHKASHLDMHDAQLQDVAALLRFLTAAGVGASAPAG